MLQSTLRTIYLTIGLIFTALGLVGVFLPILPTTPFLLVAIWAFSKSSERLHNWLYNHPKFGPTLVDWFEHGVISKRGKIISITAMLLSIPMAWHLSQHFVATAIHSVVVICVGVFIYTRPGAIES